LRDRRHTDAMPERPVVEDLMATAGRALSEAWHTDVNLYLQDPIRTLWGRHTLLLCHVETPRGVANDLPHLVVIKAAAEHNGAIFNEWAVLDWLGKIDAAANLVPQLHGGDVDAQLIILEDLGGGPTLQRVLQTHRTWAIEALVESQRLVSVIHGATRGRHVEFQAMRELLPKGHQPPEISVAPDALRDEMEAWGSPLPPLVLDEVMSASADLDVGPTFQSLTFNDSCPVNRLVTGSGVRALDLEMAAFRHPMIDGAYAAIGHLRCTAKRLRHDDGIVLPLDIRRIATDAYRQAMVAEFPEYEDDARFDADLAAAAAVWMVEILRRTRPRVEGDKALKYFSTTSCQRTIATLTAFSDLAEWTGRFPAIACWADEVSGRLQSTWPDLPPLTVCASLV